MCIRFCASHGFCINVLMRQCKFKLELFFFLPETLYFDVWSCEDFFRQFYICSPRSAASPRPTPPAVISSTVGSRQVLLSFIDSGVLLLLSALIKSKKEKVCEWPRTCARPGETANEKERWKKHLWVERLIECFSILLRLIASACSSSCRPRCVRAVLCWEDGKYLTTSEK